MDAAAAAAQKEENEGVTSPNETLPITEPRTPSDSAKTPATIKPPFAQRMKQDVNVQYADIPIILCCLVSGLCDSSAYNAWTCFVSMQTGNTVFLALGASDQPITHPYGWLKSFLSIIFFLLGSLLFSKLRHVGATHKGTLAVSFFIQGICIVIAAALVQGKVVPEPHGLVGSGDGGIEFIDLIPLGFLAFQSGGQIVSSRVLGFNEVPTTVLTSVYCDLMSDPKLLAPPTKNVKRNRRAAAVLMFLIGGIVGGWLSRSSAGMSSTLWIAAAIKLGIAIAWVFWREKQ